MKTGYHVQLVRLGRVKSRRMDDAPSFCIRRLLSVCSLSFFALARGLLCCTDVMGGRGNVTPCGLDHIRGTYGEPETRHGQWST